MRKLDGLFRALDRTPDYYSSLVVSYSRHLQAMGLASETIYSYLGACRLLGERLVATSHSCRISEIRRLDVEGFIAHILSVRTQATAANRFRSLQQFFKWCVEEGEIYVSPMEKMRQPRVPLKDIPVIDDASLAALLATCKRGASFEDARYYAILRMFIATGARRSELANLALDDLDMREGEVFSLAKGRNRGWWPSTRRCSGRSTDIYGEGAAGGIGRIHVHQFRHTFAHLALSRGMSESDLMRVAGWLSRQMVDRYGRHNADQRARAAHRRLIEKFPV